MSDTPDRILFTRIPDSPYGQDATRIVAGKISDDDFDYLFKRLFPVRGANDRVIALLIKAFIAELRRLNIDGWTIENELAFYNLIKHNNIQVTIQWK